MRGGVADVIGALQASQEAPGGGETLICPEEGCGLGYQTNCVTWEGALMVRDWSCTTRREGSRRKKAVRL